MTERSPSHHHSFLLNPYFSFLVVFFLGISVSFYLFIHGRRSLEEQRAGEFRKKADSYILTLRNIVKENNYEIKAIRSLYAVSKEVERLQFREFVQDLLYHDPAIQALAWVPRVPDPQREAYEQGARAQGYPDFTITEETPSGAMERTGRRDEYFPVYYVEPFEGNERIFGYDLSSNSELFKSLSKARNTGQKTASSRVILNRESGDSFSFLIFQPLYAKETSQLPVEERNGSLTGFLVLVYDVADLVKKSLGLIDHQGVDVRIFDIFAPKHKRFLARYAADERRVAASLSADETEPPAGSHYGTTIMIADRRWKILCSPSPGSLETSLPLQLWGILATGLLGTVFLSSCIFLIVVRINTTRRHTVEIFRAKEELEIEVGERKRLDEHLEERIRLAEMRAEIGRAIAGEESLEEMLRRCTDALVEHLGGAFARIWTLDKSGEVLALRASSGIYTRTDGSHSRIPVGKYKVGLIAKNRRPHFTNTVISDPLIRHKDWAKSQGIVSFAGLPLFIKDQLVGVMAMFSRKPLEEPILTSLVSVATEISIGIEYKRSAGLLRAERDRARRYFDIAGVMLVVLDEKQNVSLINKKGCDVLGCCEESIVGTNWFDTFIPPGVREEVRGVFIRLMAGEVEPVSYYENIIIGRDEEEILVAWHNVVLRDHNGNIIGTLSSGEDITARQKAEEEMIQREKLESLGILAGGLAHDFNNLLTGILGNISLAKIISDSPDKVRERLEEAEKASVRAQDLTQQLLTFSKGGMPIKTIVSLNEILRESTGFALRGSNVKCVYDLPDQACFVKADPGQITQVINNLMINSVQATPQGGTINVKCEKVFLHKDGAPPLKEGEYAKVTIHDEGHGIPEEHLGKIFDPYFTTKEKGSGLGLATAYSIIQRHNGHITVESSQGDGTTFTFYLSLAGEPSAKSKIPEERIPAGSGRILLMDDEEIVRSTAGEILRHIGYEVELVGDGGAAIDLYRKSKNAGHPFDAVIMDLTVPGGMGGMQAIRKLLEIDAGVKVIVSSGYSQDPVMAQFREYGFCGVIAKPYSSLKLSNALHEVLSNSDTGSRREHP